MDDDIQKFLKYGFNVIDSQNAKYELVESLRSMNRILLIHNELENDLVLEHLKVSNVIYSDKHAYSNMLRLQDLAEQTLKRYENESNLSWIEPFVLEAREIAAL